MDKKISFRDSEGNRVVGILSQPNDNKEKAAIICHGFSSNKDRPSSQAISEVFLSQGIHTLRIDFFAHGESDGKFEDVTVSHAVDDILCAIKYLDSQGYSRLALCGASFGGISSLIAASKSDRISLLILKSPVSNFVELYTYRIGPEGIADWKKKGFTYYIENETKRLMNYSYYEDFKDNDGYKAATKIKIPTLIVHGEKDPIVPIAQSIKTSKIIKDCEFHIVKGADHTYTIKEHSEEMLNAISDFLERNWSKK